jgi:hypothetical protein
MSMSDETNSTGSKVITGTSGVNGVEGVQGVQGVGPEVKDAKDQKDGKVAVAAKAVKAVKGPAKAPAAKDTKKADKAAKGKNGKNGKVPAKGVKAVKSVKPAKTGKTGKTGKTINAKAKLEVTDGCPYRPTSAYGKLFTLLLKYKEKGISRADFVKEGAKVTGKPEKNTGYDVAVVVSPTQDGKAHPSANRAADHYWVERTEGGLLKLHRR